MFTIIFKTSCKISYLFYIFNKTARDNCVIAAKGVNWPNDLTTSKELRQVVRRLVSDIKKNYLQDRERF